MQGTITRVKRDLGYGFIRAKEGRRVFFHRINLSGLDFAHIREGDSIELEVEMGPRGLKAVSVRPGKRDRSAA
jgi:cold shock CspA family protein